MTLTKLSHKLKSLLPTNTYHHELALNALTIFGIVTTFAVGLWVLTPLSPDKKLYISLSLYLLGALKFLLLDLDTPLSTFQNNLPAQKKIFSLHATFKAALLFLNKSVKTKKGSVKLNRLPWYALIGPPKAGKTFLLEKADVHYLMHKHRKPDTEANTQSENCEWWVTREACLIDIPGKYFATKVSQPTKGMPSVSKFYLVAWSLFLRLVHRHRGKQGLSGVILTLPASSFIHGERKSFLVDNTIDRLNELHKQFPDVSCRIVITKCDLIPGFTEFFADSSQDEISQSWGISLAKPQHNERLDILFQHRFNDLIKKINQQLLWRLHQERNPFARPYIKDFPLQLEKLKTGLSHFFNALQATPLPLHIETLNLTSALQNKSEPITNVIQHVDDTTRSMELLNTPAQFSRPYFIKQFLQHGLNAPSVISLPQTSYLIYGGYAFAITCSLSAILWFTNDFKHGVQTTQNVQSYFANYKIAMSQTHNQDDHLLLTLELLNALQPHLADSTIAEKIGSFFNFYSKKADANANAIYQTALQQLLIPEMGAFYSDYLKIPVNHNAENIYAVLKSYMMLNDPAHYQPEYILATTQAILPKMFTQQQSDQLMGHLKTALNLNTFALNLDKEIIQQTRRYLVSMQSVQLAYIILRDFRNNDVEQEINLGTIAPNPPVFTTKLITNQLPAMFTGEAFATIMTQDSVMSAQQALVGNWVLGNNPTGLQQPEIFNDLLNQLRNMYINNYVDIWETFVSNIRLAPATSLSEVDQIILQLLDNQSPLLTLLKTVHNNTNFEAIIAGSPKLQSIDAIVQKNNEYANLLYEIFTSLQNLHLYLLQVLNAPDPSHAAFNLLSKRLHNEPDAISQLRVVADKSPEPIKTWLNALDDNAWHFMMREAANYLNTAWQTQVIQPYQANIANRYPFNIASNQDVDLNQFRTFFGNPGTIVNFYKNYLQAFVDTSKPEWHWKKSVANVMPLSNAILRQIQLGMRIHKVFFPKDDTTLKVAFSLQPHNLGKSIKTVEMNIANQEFLDGQSAISTPHEISWPAANNSFTSLQLTMDDNKVINHHYAGEWGWYRLINQSFDSVINKEQIMLNFSMNENQAKYILNINSQHNPFLTLNLQRFSMPDQLIKMS